MNTYTRAQLLAFWMVAIDSAFYDAADEISDAIDACDVAADRSFAEIKMLDDAAFTPGPCHNVHPCGLFGE